MKKRLWALVAASLVAFLVISVLVVPRTGTAAPTSNYAYVINGKEVAVGIDPLALKSGLLIPEAMLDHVGIRLVEKDNSTIVLSRETVTVTLRYGSTSALEGERSIMLSSAPIRLSGLAYVPAGALAPLGIRLTQESNLLLVNSWPSARSSHMSDEEFRSLRGAAMTERSVYPTRDHSVRVQVTRLTRDTVLAPSWTADPFLRGRAKELLESDLLLLHVSLFNQANRSISFPSSSYYLVDDLGREYPVSSQSLQQQGDLFGTVGPHAKPTGVLVYPTPHPDARSITLYLISGSVQEALVTYPLTPTN
ncbi:MAG: hypothetical protein ACOY94_11425 [Bacillota bacterium]